jgi:hypothetical protein
VVTVKTRRASLGAFLGVAALALAVPVLSYACE